MDGTGLAGTCTSSAEIGDLGVASIGLSVGDDVLGDVVGVLVETVGAEVVSSGVVGLAVGLSTVGLDVGSSVVPGVCAVGFDVVGAVGAKVGGLGVGSDVAFCSVGDDVGTGVVAGSVGELPSGLAQ